MKTRENSKMLIAMDWILIITMIGLTLFAYIQGAFIQKTTIETCEGVPTNCKGDEKICQAIIQATKNKIATINPYTGLKLNTTSSQD